MTMRPFMHTHRETVIQGAGSCGYLVRCRLNISLKKSVNELHMRLMRANSLGAESEDDVVEVLWPRGGWSTDGETGRRAMRVSDIASVVQSIGSEVEIGEMDERAMSLAPRRASDGGKDMGRTEEEGEEAGNEGLAASRRHERRVCKTQACGPTCSRRWAIRPRLRIDA